MTSFFRGVSEGESAGESPLEHKLTAEVKGAGPVAEVTYGVDEDQTFRYADASGDHMPIAEKNRRILVGGEILLVR